MTVNTNSEILHNMDRCTIWCPQNCICNGKFLTMVKKLILFFLLFNIPKYKIHIRDVA
uniref:Uncharacterized protein n=1 Tax=Rhizophora mucronata TaxID=61149 RepID=A0A2P2PF62_RHIMU